MSSDLFEALHTAKEMFSPAKGNGAPWKHTRRRRSCCTAGAQGPLICLHRDRTGLCPRLGRAGWVSRYGQGCGCVGPPVAALRCLQGPCPELCED